MLTRTLTIAAALLALAGASHAHAQTQTHIDSSNQTTTSSAAAQADKPINTHCPMSGNPIVASAGTVNHGGHSIGFCCPGCAGAFANWDNSRKDEAVRVVLAAQAEAAEQTAPPAIEPQLRPYTLDTCAGSGEKLGSMGKPVVKKYNGREIRFCCDSCVEPFEADLEASMARVDKAMIAQQLMHYPLDTCPVAGGKLGSMGEPVNMIYDNRLVRFCCSGCIPAFKADPEKYFAQMDKQILAAQAPGYALTDCPVGKHAHNGAEGQSYDIIYMNRLVRLCCEGCEWKLHANPAGYIAEIDAAYAEAQRATYPLKTCLVGGEALGDDAFELIAGAQLVRLCCESCAEEFKAEPQRRLKKIVEARGG